MTDIHQDDRETAPVGSTVDLLLILWKRRKAWIACLATTIVLGAVAYLVIPTTYESETAVLLVEKNPQAVTRDARFESGFEAFLATHRALIVSPLIVERAVENGQLQSLKMFADIESKEDLVETIIESLEAGNAGRELGENADSIMTLTFTGTDAEEAPRVVAAIVESYKSFLDEAYRGRSDEVVRLVARASKVLEHDLRKLEDAYIAFRKQSPLVSQGLEEVNPLQERLAAIDQRRSELMLLRTQLVGQLAAIEKAKQEGIGDEELIALIADIRRHFSEDEGTSGIANGLDTQMIQLTDREQQLLELYGPNHPHVATLRKRIETVRKLQALPTTAHITHVSVEDAGSGEDVSETFLQHLHQTIHQIDASEKSLRELYEREHAAAKELSGYQLRDERFQREITRTEALYDEVISKLEEASLVKGIGGYEAHIIAPPREGKKAGPSLKIFGAGSILAGLMLGFAVAVSWEFVDRLRPMTREE